RLSRGRAPAAFALRPALGVVRVAGSNRPGPVVLVVRKLGAPPWHEEPGISVQGDGALRRGGRAGSNWTRDPGALRGSDAASAPALPGLVLHGAGGRGRWIAGAIRSPTSRVALAGIVHPAQPGNVFCAAASVS